MSSDADRREKIDAIILAWGPIAIDDYGRIPPPELGDLDFLLRPLGVRVTTDPLKPHIDLATYTLNLEAIR